ERAHLGSHRPQEALPPPRRVLRRRHRTRLRRGRHFVPHRPQRNPGAGGGERLRQVHGRQGHPEALRPHRRSGGAGRAADRRPLARRAPAHAPARAGGVPGPVQLAQPADAGARHPGRAHPQLRLGQILGRPGGTSRRPDGQGPPAARRREPLAARVQRGAAPAHRHRPRPRGRAGPHHLRRGGLGARRFGQGADRQPAPGPPERVAPRPAVHLPRPGHRGAHDAPGRGDVPRQDRGGGAQAQPLRRAQAPLHGSAALRRAGADARCAARAHHPQGRRAEPDQPAQGLPLPHPLPLRLRPLPGGGAAPRRRRHGAGARPPRRLPPARPAGERQPAGRGEGRGGAAGL
ncbi:MAG: Oligopeptide transport ATP-binding protein OppF, partial [uncultured Acetobacteraceae bacterium]